jgi:gliding motility-associated-like protein
MKIRLPNKLTILALLTLAFLLPRGANASHVGAGEIFYEWIGDEQGKGLLDYRIYVTIFRNTTGIDYSGPPDVCVYRESNPSGTAINLSMTKLLPPNLPPKHDITLPNQDEYGWFPGTAFPGDNDAWEINNVSECATAVEPLSEYRFVGEVTLTGAFTDWRIGVEPVCCRDQNANLNGGGGFYLEADLNNAKGPNSSPRIITPPVKNFCVVQPGQQPFQWYQTASEEDGDSLFYRFHPDGSLDGSCPGQGVNQIPFATPFTSSNPLPSNPPVSINQQSGIFTLSPTQSDPEGYIVKIEVVQYRLDTTNGIWLNVGNTVRELQVPITGNCLTNVQDGPELDLTQPNVTSFNFTKNDMDSLEQAYQLPIIKGQDSVGSAGNFNSFDMAYYQGYDCLNESIRLTWDTPIRCNTITPTDFRVTGPDGVPRPVDSVATFCQVDGVTSVTELFFDRAMDRNGNYLLQIRTGTDSNTVENECGFATFPYYSVLVEVKGCPLPEYDLDGLTVNDDKDVEIRWSGNNDLNDTNFIESFRRWNIYKSEIGKTPLSPYAQVDSATARSFVDTMANRWFVDHIHWNYAITLVYNGQEEELSRLCSNILLQQDTTRNTATNMGLYWEPYPCIPDSLLQYNVYQGKVDTINQTVTWQYIESVTDTSYDLAIPEADSLNEGVYATRVVGRNPNGAAFKDSSMSNWLYYEIIWYPPPPPPEPLGEIVIPNVITPNGDGINDRFYIKPPENGEPYEKLSISVYNRNGVLVFEDPEFEERNTASEGWAGVSESGNKLADGVYYYILKMSDPLRGEETTRKGNITIMSSIQ